MVNPIYRKTEAGLDEIKTRARKLDHKLRALLLIVNGERREQELLSQLGGMGVGPESLAQLVQMSLVEPVPEPAREPASRAPAAGPAAEDSNLFSLYAMRRVEAPGAATQGSAAALSPPGGDAPHTQAQIQAYQRLYHFTRTSSASTLGCADTSCRSRWKKPPISQL